MAQITETEASADFRGVLRRVEEGEQFTITVRGVPIADLVPRRPPTGTQRSGLATEILSRRVLLNPPGSEHLSLRELVEEGRR